MMNFEFSRTGLFKPCYTALALIISSGILPTAMAQNALEEIVVTAQKREQGINDVGITVNAFTAEDLQNFGVSSAENLEQMMPGLTVTQSQSSGVPVYTIRGVGFDDFTITASSTVGLYNDGVSISYPVMSRGLLFDVERVEVLKGPQGDLYGRNTTAGQINFVSKKPTEDFQAGIRAGYGTYQTTDIEGFFSGAISENVSARLSAKHLGSNEGWQESISRPGDELGEKDETAVRLLIDVEFTENLSGLFRYQRFDVSSDSFAPVATAFLFPPDFFANTALDLDAYNAFFAAGDIDSEDSDWSPGFDPVDDSEHNTFSATFNWDLGAVSLISITAFDDYERISRFDTGGVFYEDADVTSDSTIEAFSQELRIESNGDGKLYWTAGVFYSDDEVEESYLLEFSDSIGLDLDNRFQQDSDSFAVFAHTEYQFTDQFRLTLGGRYTQEERTWSGCTFDVGDGSLAAFWNFLNTPGTIGVGLPDPGPAAPGDCLTYNDIPGSAGFGDFNPFTDTIDTDQFMGKVSLDYRVNDDVLIYGTVSTGFKSGGYTGAASQYHTQLLPYDKETLLSYELGVKATLLEGAMQLNAATFLYDYEDKQEITLFPSPVPEVSPVGTINVDESEVFGVEAELAWLISEGLNFNVGIAYLDTEIKEYAAICAANPLALQPGCAGVSAYRNINTFDSSGFALPNSPELQYSGTLSYTWPISSALMMNVATDFAYKDDNIGSLAAPDDDSIGVISDYTLFNVRMGVMEAEGKWSVTLWSRNVGDHYYWTASSQGNSAATRYNGMPRTVGLTFSYNHF